MSTLTRDEILAMPAGLELDAAVQRHFFTWPVERFPSYSTDIAAAWEVLRQVRGWELTRRCFFYVMLQGAVRHRLGTDGDVLKNGALLLAMEPEDICKAALLMTLTEAE